MFLIGSLNSSIRSALKFRLNYKLLIVINILGIGLAVGAIVSLFQVDMLVHGTLYDYGLQFWYDWAMPYWLFERLAIGLFAGVASVNAFSAVYILFAEKDWTQKPSKQVHVKPKPEVVKEQPKEQPKPEPVEEERPPLKEEFRKPMVTDTSDDGVEVVALPMVCNKCGKVFTQPLCMFDFKSGKPRLVNVCPYCNAILAVSGNSKE
jgi:hypothetical protein